MTNDDPKAVQLYEIMLTGRPVTNWEMTIELKMLDVRKEITRITRKARKIGRIMNRRWCARDGRRYKEYWLGTITDSAKKRAK